MQSDFIRERITALRMEKGISELKMSRDLGRSDGYIHHIAAGKALPSMAEFLNICEYFDITPEAFFNERASSPILVQKIVDELPSLAEDDLLMLISLISKIKKAKK